MQWESLIPFLHKKTDKEKDDSVYQDFSTVLIDANHYYYDLKLQDADENNPFIKVLRLVWEEYKRIFIGKDLVLPWFKTLGWT